MSISKWAYDPDKCDNDYCPGSCYICNKAEINEEHFPVEVALAMVMGEENDRDSSKTLQAPGLLLPKGTTRMDTIL